jgi:hypothetical protein
MDRNYPHRACWRLASASLLACLFAWPTASLAAVSCKPLLTVKTVREIRPSSTPLQPWLWRATIVADSTYCAATQGAFEIDFIRTKEDAPDLQFTAKFRWASREFDVTIALALDESIHEYRIGFIAPCLCREPPYELPQAASR